MGDPMSETDAEIFYYELCKSNDIVYPLVRLFKKEVDTDTLMLNDYHGELLCARVKHTVLENLTTTLRHGYRGGAVLNFYDGAAQDILDKGRSDAVYCSNIATLAATPKTMGTWVLGRGELMAYTLSVNVHEKMTFPSEMSKWFFDLMSWLALISTEQKFPHERETWWERDKENSG